jgi:hypothetical protein
MATDRVLFHRGGAEKWPLRVDVGGVGDSSEAAEGEGARRWGCGWGWLCMSINRSATIQLWLTVIVLFSSWATLGVVVATYESRAGSRTPVLTGETKERVQEWICPSGGHGEKYHELNTALGIHTGEQLDDFCSSAAARFAPPSPSPPPPRSNEQAAEEEEQEELDEEEAEGD